MSIMIIIINKIMFKEDGVYPVLSLTLFKIFTAYFIWSQISLYVNQGR